MTNIILGEEFTLRIGKIGWLVSTLIKRFAIVGRSSKPFRGTGDRLMGAIKHQSGDFLCRYCPAKSTARSSGVRRQSSYGSSSPFRFRSLKAYPSTVRRLTPELAEYPNTAPSCWVTIRIESFSTSVHFVPEQAQVETNKAPNIPWVSRTVIKGFRILS